MQAKTIEIDEVAFGRIQQELGVQMSNWIIGEVARERMLVLLGELERGIAQRDEAIAALRERVARAEKDNAELKAQMSPRHAEMERLRDQLIAKTRDHGAHEN